MSENEKIGDRILMLLKQNNMTQKELAFATKISVATMSRYINNKREPKANNILKIAEVLNVTTDFLVYGEADEYLPLKECVMMKSENMTAEQKLEIIQILSRSEDNGNS